MKDINPFAFFLIPPELVSGFGKQEV